MIRNHATIKNVSGVILVIGMNVTYTDKLAVETWRNRIKRRQVTHLLITDE